MKVKSHKLHKFLPQKNPVWNKEKEKENTGDVEKFNDDGHKDNTDDEYKSNDTEN